MFKANRHPSNPINHEKQTTMLTSIQTHTTQNNKLGICISLGFMDVGYCKNKTK